MKIAIIIGLTLFGFLLGKASNHQNHITKSISHKECSTENIQKPTTIPLASKCLYSLPNRGEKFDLSTTQAASRVRGYFTIPQKDHYEAPNEFNVNTNDLPFGESAQKNDPREKLLVRFKINNKDSTKKGTSGFASDLKSALEDKLKCDPTLRPLTGEKRSNFLQEIMNKRLTFKGDLNPRIRSKSILGSMDRLFGIYRDNRLMTRYKLFENDCSGGINIPTNFCYSDPRFDLGLHDIFVISSENRAVEKIYCKKTSENTWVLIKTIVFKIREETQ